MTAKAQAPVTTTPSMKLLALALTSPLLLLPCGQWSLAPLALLSLLGLFMFLGLLSQRQSFNTEDKALQILPRCFLFLWLPMLVSAIDAESPRQVLNIAGYYPLYGLMALAVVVLLRATAALRQVIILLAWLVSVWAFDGLAQTALGINMFNAPLSADGHAQSFFADHERYGFYLGALATLPLYTLYLVGANRLSHLLLTMFMLTAVLVLGTLESWIMMFWSLLPYLYLVYIKPSSRPLLPIIILPLWLDMVFMVNLHCSSHAQQVVAQSHVWFADLQSIWQAGINVASQHWFNGVGVGQFAQTVQSAPAVQTAGIDMSHPHNVILEILVSTGALGLLAFILIWAALWRMWGKAVPMQHKLALPVLMPVVALWWPFNSHHGFYEQELAALTFFMLALGIAGLTHQTASAKP